MAYNSNLPEDITLSRADIRENLRALKEDKIADAATAITADSAAKLTNARKVSLEGDATGSTTFDGSADVAIKVDVLSADTSAQCTGNAATATKLETARNINGVAFDGTKDITITQVNGKDIATVDKIPTSLPANGGNADTVDGKHASDFVPVGYGVPVGTVAYLATQNAPVGWLKANGVAVSRIQYADLFVALGTLFGAGDGTTTFNLPDLRGEFIRGFDDGRGVDNARSLGSTQLDNLKSHKHDLYKYLVRYGNYPESVDNVAGWANHYQGNTTGESGTFATGGSETRPRNVALLACIKY